jgi:hypothetical protein
VRLGRALPAILVALPLAVALILPAGVMAQGSDLAASVVQGPCPASGPELAPLTSPSAGPVGRVASSTSSIPLSVSDLLASPSAIALLDPTLRLLACGDVTGEPGPTGELAVAVPGVEGSTVSGVAFLTDLGDGSTTVRLAVLSGGGSTPGGSPDPSGAPVTSVSLDSSVWFAGFTFAFSSARVDPTSGELVIEGTVTNEGTADQSLLAIQVNSAVAVGWNGQSLPARFGTGPNVAAGATVQEEIRAAVPEGFSLADAVLTLGKADEHQAIVPLAAGVAPTFEAPVDVPVDARAVIKGLVTVRALGAQVVPALCGGTPSAMDFLPAPADQQSLVLRVRESAGPNAVVVGSFATGPGGISAPGTPGGTSLMGPRDTVVDGRFCYTLPAPIGGKVKVTVQAFPGGVGEKRKSFTVEVP